MRLFFITVTLFLLSLFSLHAQSYKVLFIGNSYTEVNNLPQLVSDMAISTDDTIVFQSHTPGGCTFQEHVTGAASYIQHGGWDFVVLQEQSQLPSFPINQFMVESYPYAQQLCQMIQQYNPEAHTVFYMTWGRKNGDPTNAVFYPPLATYEGMDSLLFARYMMMAQDNQAWVSPVGYTWHYIRDHYPDIELYSSDGSHPSMMGSYVAACCFYTVFFQKDPRAIAYNSSLDHDMAQIAKETVANLVYDSLSKWFFTQDTVTEPDTTSVAEQIWPVVHMKINTQTRQLEVMTEDHASFEISIITLGGQCLARYERTGEDVSYTFPISGITDGLYLIRYTNRARSVVRKFYIPSL